MKESRIARITSNSSESLREDQPTHDHTIGLASGTFLVVASMIGVGVFTTSGFTLGALQSPHYVLAAWFVGGLIAICGALSYSAIAVYYRESGGEYYYLTKAVHPAAGFVAGWVSLFAGFTGPIAFAAKAFAKYTLPLFASSDQAQNFVTQNLVATLAIALAAAAHAFHARLGLFFQNTIVILKIMLLLVLIAIGLRAVNVPISPASFSTLDFVNQLVWISLSYCGFNAVIYAAGEVKDLDKTLPQATLVGTVLVMVLYITLNFIFVYKTPSDLILFQEDIAAISAQHIGGQWLGHAMRILIGISLLTSVFAMIMLGPRVYAQMANDSMLPKLMRNPKGIAGILVQSLLAAVVVWVGSFHDLLNYISLTLSITAALTVSSLFYLRSKGASIHVIGWPLTPAIFVVVTLTLSGISSVNAPDKAFASLATIVSGVIIYFFLSRFRSRV